jgi:small conductance mechanosensitive channel
MVLADVVTPDEVNACGDDAGAACLFVLRRTDNVVLARAADWLVAKPLKIILILVVAAIAYQLIGRVIRRIVAGVVTASQKVGELGEAMPGPLLAPPPDPRALQRAETVGVVLRSIARVAIIFFAVVTILGEFGVDLGPLLAGAGIVGIAIGFGAQTLVRDFLSGFFMIAEDQFGVGDVVDVGEASGSVEGVSLRTTRIRDVEGTLWHVPNGQILRVGNKSQQWSRALLDIQVAYDADLDEARRIIKQVADEVAHDAVLGPSILEPPEVWGVEGFGPTGVAIRLVVKTRPSDQWKVLRELRARIKAGLDRADVHLGYQPGAPAPPVPPTASATPAPGPT